MIKVNVLIKDGYAVNVSVIGHANYDDYGKDIVCSAVSSIVTTTVNGIISIDSDAILYQVSDGRIVIKIKKDDNVTLKLIDNMLDLLKKLSIGYPNNIKIEEGV